MSESLLQYKPYKSDFELSSKWKLKKNPISGFFFLWGGGAMNTTATIFYAQDTLSRPLLQNHCIVSWKYS